MIKCNVTTYQSLLHAINLMTPEERQQPVTVLPSEGLYQEVVRIHEDEDLLENKNNDEDVGTIKELQEAHGDKFHINDYVVIRPKRIVMFTE